MNIDKKISSSTLREEPYTTKKEEEYMGSKESIYTSVTNRIVTELEKGVAPWVKPWTASLPYNAATNRPYSGVNILMLWDAGAERGFTHSAWLTFRQAKELGGHIKKGEKGTRVVYASRFTKMEEDPKTGEETEQEIPFLKGYTIFNITQTEGLPEHLYQVLEPKPFNEAVFETERFIQALGAEVRHGGSRAFYSSEQDTIRLPQPGDFRSGADYYATSLHEHCHWSGHETRLKRDFSGRFGTEAYAAEELVAELASAFLCAHLAVPGKLQHPEYIGSWLKVLKSDTKAIFTAARHATEAADYLRSLNGEAVGRFNEEKDTSLPQERSIHAA